MNETAPRLFAGQSVGDLIVPIMADQFHERGISLACTLAANWELPIRLVHVSAPGTGSVDESVQAAKERFIAAEPGLSADAVEVVHESVAGGLDATRAPDSLIVIASDHVSLWRDTGSVAEQVINASHSQVLAFGPACTAAETNGSVIVALDGSHSAEAAIASGRALAEVSGATLWLVTVVPSAAVEQTARLQALGERVSESAYLRERSSELKAQGVNVGWEIIHDDEPIDALVAFANSTSASFLVAVNRSSTRLGRRAFGSTCLGLIERASVPVLVVTPPADAV